MTAKITRLRIAGFKSFADPATIDILPGLTGIVGPNGCGKSNVVEAMRWAMGESSARALRGGELDDLIFAGTGARPARSLAEVTLWLDEAAGLAPNPFGEAAELEIVRRAERGAGSDFRLNGRSIRARDVTTLFADLSSGARSSSIISQNRVGTLIAARPEERRALLEEAAGISGLHARRHDAELKLRQTEANLARAEDLRQQIDARLETLDGQSVQAREYRRIASALREDEVALEALLHARAEHAVTETQNALARTRAVLEEAGTISQASARAVAACQDALPLARTQRDEARALTEKLLALAQTAEQAEKDAARGLDIACERVAEGELAASAATTRLQEAETQLRAEIEAGDALDRSARLAPEQANAALGRLSTAQDALATAEATSETADEAHVLARLEHDQRRQALQDAQTRLTTFESDVATLRTRLDAIRATIPAETTLVDAETARAEAETKRTSLRERLAQAERAHQEARLAAELALRAQREGEQAASARKAERERLAGRQTHLADQLQTVSAAHADAAGRQIDDAAMDRLSAAYESATQTREAARLREEEARRDLAAAEAARLEAHAESQSLRERIDRARRDRTFADDAARRAEAEDTRTTKEFDAAADRTIPHEEVSRAQTRAETAEADLAFLAEKIVAAEGNAETLRATLDRQTRAHAEAEAVVLRLRAQMDGLAPEDGPSDTTELSTALPRLMDDIRVPPDLVGALASALADGLEAPVSDDATTTASWRALPPLPPAAFPSGVTPLGTLLDAPAALQRRMMAIGLLPDDGDAAELQATLAPGQCVVTRDGALWRWDGYRVAAGRPSRAAREIERRHAFMALEEQLRGIEGELPQLLCASVEADANATAAGATLADLRRLRPDAEARVTRLKQEAADLAARAAAADLAREQAERARDATRATLEAAKARAQEALTVLDALPDAAQSLASAEEAATRAQAARTALDSAVDIHTTAQRAADAARETRQATQLEQAALRERLQTLAPTLVRLRDDLEATSIALSELATAEEGLSLDSLSRTASESCRQRDEALATVESLRGDLASWEEHLSQGEEQVIALRSLRAESLAQEAAVLPELAAREAACAAQRSHLESLPAPLPVEGAEEAARTARTVLAAAREARDSAQTALSLLEAEHRRVAEDLPAARERIRKGDVRLVALRSEETEARERLARLNAALREAEAVPLRLHAETRRRDEALDGARRTLAERQDALATAEAALQEAASRRDAHAHQAGAAREDEIRLTERLSQATAAREALLAAGPAPDLPAPADLSEQAETALRRRVARLIRERDALGPVNLRAELEFEEARAQSEILAHEHGELQEAIHRLRGSIGHLNREGRERLQAVFVEVDQHFQTLFSRMFGGGRAHLGLVGSDDPLEAGLEIFAQPPGKKLSTLSLLSGGEQALTALSLVFATFKCQPAPICVLDEVDAPLDDANVERLCSLVRDMAHESETRFLVVTHHQLTMAHMDRLFGVTMQERGVSRVLSVDLAGASAFATASS